MEANPKARRVARAAREAKEQIELAIVGDAFDPITSTRHFRIAAWDYTQQVLLPPLLQRLRAEAPRVSVEVVPVLAFTLCARPEHPLWSDAVTPERYAAAAHLLVAPFGATRRGAVDLALQAVGLTRHVAAFVPNFASAPELLSQTDLIATLPRKLVERARVDLKTAPPPVPPPSFQIEAVWHGRAHADDGHRWPRQQLRAAAETVNYLTDFASPTKSGNRLDHPPTSVLWGPRCKRSRSKTRGNPARGNAPTLGFAFV